MTWGTFWHIGTRLADRKADIVMPLADTDCGVREFTVRDLEGNLWRFGDYAGVAS